MTFAPRPSQNLSFVPSHLPTSTFLLLCAGISLIEWPSRLGDDLPLVRLDITFRIHDDADVDEMENEDDENCDTDQARPRYLTLQAHGQKWEDRIRLLEEGGYLDDLLLK